MPALASFALVEALVWGLFWSLQLSKPMPAAVIAAVCIVVVNISTINARALRWEHYFEPWSVVRTLLVVALLAADIVLARKWLAGRGWEWSIPWDRFIIHRKLDIAAPAKEHASAWRRASQRFHWLEWQSIRVFLVFATLASIVASIPFLIWPRPSSIPLVSILVYFLPLFAGLTAWQGEQSRYQFRFLANRGISPVGLWLNKFGVWLITLCGVIALLGLIVTLALEAGLRLRHEAAQGRWLAVVELQRAFSEWPTVASFLFFSYLALYASSFTVSLYFRRGIFAFGAGLTLSELERQELRWWITDLPALESQYRQTLKEKNRMEQELGRKRWMLRPWLTRERRIAACEFSNQLRLLRTPPTQRSFAGFPPRLAENDPDPAWNFRGGDLGSRRALAVALGEPVGITSQVINLMWDRETRIRCTFAAMSAVAFRQSHGRLPRTLAEVTPQFASKELLIDPWNGGLLQIQLDGLPGQIADSYIAGAPIEARTPFIWSAGPDALIISERYYNNASNAEKMYHFVPTHRLYWSSALAPRYVFALPTEDRPADALKPEDEVRRALPFGL